MPTAVPSNHGDSGEKQRFSIGSRIIHKATLASGIYLLLLLTAVLPGTARAQTFATIPALNFSMSAGGANPLPQVITVTSTGANFDFNAVASTTTGGSWLTINPSNFGCCTPTPQAITVSAAGSTLSAGSYSGQILITAGANSMTVPVTLIVHPATAAFFDQVAGGLTFTLVTSGKNPPGQLLEVRNAGTGTLSWHATTSTADGGAWLTVSPASGTAPTTTTVSIHMANLPGAGLTAGTFTGQVALAAAGDKVTIPITVIVNASVFAQIDPLNFSKTFAGANPLPQVITIPSTGTNFDFSASVQNSTGGAWLQISPSNFGCCTPTPQAVTVSANPAITLAAGTYMSEIVINSDDGKQVLTVPVTLKVNPDTTAYFDDVAGAAEFSMLTGGAAPPPQELHIRNAGAGTLTWAASTTTADGGAWLKVSAPNGAAPASLSVSVVPGSLPGGSLTAGIFIGQVVLSSAAGRVTIPVTMNVGASVFRQINPLDFTKVLAGANPLPQEITVSSTGANFDFTATAVSNSGTANWLQISPSNFGCCTPTPQVITVSANPAVALAAGSYTGEVIIVSNGGADSMTVPVTLTVADDTVTSFFDTLPGQVSFTMLTNGTTPPPQVLEIRNAGIGTLNWTASTTTADGGAWLKVAPPSGTAPAFLSVSVVPASLPGGGLVAGTFSGQVVLKTAGDEVTIPVTMVVGASVFRQINALDFTKVFGGSNPLPQTIQVASTGTNFDFTATAVSFSGTANWLQISPNNFGCCTPTPQVITVSANPAVTLAAGTYTGEINILANGGSQSLTVPVTLTIAAQTATFFDTLPGQVSFSMVTSGNAPPAQALEIRNAGAGTLSFTAATSTADGGAWLKVTPAGATAPTVISVSVVPTNLPGGGLVAGTFSGQLVLNAAGDRETIPVTIVVGDPVFRQINALDFTKVFGGPNPLPQVIEVAATSTNFDFTASVANSTGGNWLQISPSNFGCCTPTPQALTVTANPAVTLAAGTYTSEIIIVSNDGKQSLIVPVTLTVAAATAAFFDDLPSGVDFFQATGGTAPAVQSVPVRNAGAGTLNWTASLSTADGGAWLRINAASGSAPSTLNVSVLPAKLPGGGLTAGTFTGQIVLVTKGDRETIPVTYVVGANVFQQLSPLSFSKPFGGSNPASQTLDVASTGTNFTFYGVTATSTGGSWLQINPSNYGCCTSTPLSVTVSVNPVTTLAPGEYLGEVMFGTNSGAGMLIVPVILTITSSTPTSTPAFTPPAGTYDATQTVTITDATKGSAIYYTTDGSTPTPSSTRYSVPITVSATETIRAIATAPGQPQSAVASATYTITAQKAAEPAATSLISITEATTGATVYYTTDGSTPTTSSAQYPDPYCLRRARC